MNLSCYGLFQVYDSGNREPLLNAYHESATMSVLASYPPRRTDEFEKRTFGEYISRSRNLTRLQNKDVRREKLKSGRLAITSFISELPKTEHDFNSFTLDVPMAGGRRITIAKLII